MTIREWFRKRGELVEDGQLEPLRELVDLAVMVAVMVVTYLGIALLITGVLWSALPMDFEHALTASIFPAFIIGWILFDWMLRR